MKFSTKIKAFGNTKSQNIPIDTVRQGLIKT
jgi:hypothetical protein